MDVTRPTTCPQCAEPFSCGAADGSCWCTSLPAVMEPHEQARCLCPTCLAKTIANRIDKHLESLDLEQAVAFARSHAKRGTPIEHLDYTLNREGNLVLSKWFLLKRGRCCKERCLNCPYPEGTNGTAD